MADNQVTPFQLTDQFTMDNFNQRINETNTALQNKLGGIESTNYPGCYYRTVDGVVEWFNPPMVLGSINDDGSYINEYRTTERYLGKPVYAIALNFGPPPQSGDGKLTWNKLPNLNRPINCQAVWGDTVLPYDDGEGLNMRVRALSNSNVTVNANYDWTSAGLNIIVVIKYWKTTD